MIVNNKLSVADYIVVLDHEGGKGALRHKNKVAVFEKLSGDVVMSRSTLSLGGSVQDACEGVTRHWAQHSTEIRAGEAKEAAAHSAQGPSPQLLPVAASTSPKLTVSSTPEGADIELDGSFVREYAIVNRHYARRTSSSCKEKRVQGLEPQAQGDWRRH